MHRGSRARPAGMQQGFTYLGLLIAIAILGIWLAAASEVWSTALRRHQMEQLDWAGQQLVQAIGSYYESSPGGAKTYPQRLDDLLEDRRQLGLRRHLREVYVNPFSGRADWELVMAPGGEFTGVRVVVMISPGEQVVREFMHRPP